MDHAPQIVDLTRQVESLFSENRQLRYDLLRANETSKDILEIVRHIEVFLKRQPRYEPVDEWMRSTESDKQFGQKVAGA